MCRIFLYHTDDITQGKGPNSSPIMILERSLKILYYNIKHINLLLM